LGAGIGAAGLDATLAMAEESDVDEALVVAGAGRLVVAGVVSMCVAGTEEEVNEVEVEVEATAVELAAVELMALMTLNT
jgi:hypothetical protein